MPKTTRERRRQTFLQILSDHDLTHEEAAEMLHSSIDRIKSWLKPETSASSNPVPPWAIELMTYKLADRKRKAKQGTS